MKLQPMAAITVVVLLVTLLSTACWTTGTTNQAPNVSATPSGVSTALTISGIPITMSGFPNSEAANVMGVMPALQDLNTVKQTLTDLPAPSWVTPGIRLSYYSAAAQVPHAYVRYVLDENGNWVDQYGNRYRQENIDYGAAGQGVTQVDVLSADARGTAVNTNSWLLPSQGGPPIPIGTTSGVFAPAGGVSNWYINPAALATMPEQNGPNLEILRMPYTIGQKTYNALAIQMISDSATRAYIYDLQDGKLLAYFSAVANEPTKSTLFAESFFLNVRQMDLPWLGQDLPSWVQAGKILSYEGTVTVESTAASPFIENIAVKTTIDSATSSYYTYKESGTLYSPGFLPQSYQSSLMGGIGEPAGLAVPITPQTAGLALPTTALASLRPGQVIDSDPVTGITTKVIDVTNNVATIGLANQVYSAQLSYDIASGTMVGYTATMLSAGGVNLSTDLQVT